MNTAVGRKLLLFGLLLTIVTAIVLLNRPPAVAPPTTPNLSDTAAAARAAITQALAAAVADPDSPERRGDLGKALLAHQFDAAAASEFHSASLLAPLDFRWKYLQGLAETPFSRTAALDCFQAAATLNPSAWLPHARSAELLLAENRLLDAAAQIRTARRLAPDELRPALAEIRLLLLQKQPAAARIAAESLAARGTLVRELVELQAQALFQLNQTEAARLISRQLQNEELTPAGWNDPLAAAVLAWSTDPEDILNQARSLAASGNFTQAEQLLLNSTARAASHPEFITTLARIQLESGKPEIALNTTDSALKDYPNAPAILLARGNALFLLERINDAAQSYALALQHKPDLAHARFNLARCQLRQGQSNEATESLLETLRTAPEMTAARLVLAGLLLNQKQTSEATKQLQILITQLPNSDPQLSALLAQLQTLQTTD
ncbi:hypothetical protein LBMAG46_39050 [Planctomycetia bacterium]|nr:hypothetical protein LBMAG46_39050 [Planctomycetia bacterium]